MSESPRNTRYNVSGNTEAQYANAAETVTAIIEQALHQARQG